MGRRKPLHVQRKRPRDARAHERDGAVQSGDGDPDDATVDLVHDGDAAQSSIGRGTRDNGSTRGKKKRQKRQFVGYEDPIMRVWERALSDTAAGSAPPLRLSFRCAWTAQYRDDALWLEWPAFLLQQQQQEQENSKLFHALAEYERLRDTSNGSSTRNNERAAIGLELRGRAGKVTLTSDDDATKLPTQLQFHELFPGTHAMWSPHLVSLVQSELLVMEIVHLCGANREHSQPRGGGSFVWRVGIAWRPYWNQFSRGSLHASLPVRNASCHRSMHHVMIWLLRSARGVDRQCEYPYWKEIDVLYAQYVGSLHSEEDPCQDSGDNVLQSVSFDIHDIYARINTQRQLQRDTSNFEEASALQGRHGGGSSLLPTLRPYQKAAVSWMLSREQPLGRAELQRMNLLVRFPGRKASSLAYDPFTAHFCSPETSSGDNGGNGEASSHRHHVALNASFNAPSVRGGILADEMGLGKTVEVITLVLCNPWPKTAPVLQSTHHVQVDGGANDSGSEAEAAMVRDCICGWNEEEEEHGWVCCDFCKTWHHQICTGYTAAGESGAEAAFRTAESSAGAPNDFAADSFMCFHCQATEKPAFACKTTLIVSPEAIHDQWETELKRHVKPGVLRLLRYPGVKALRGKLASLKGPGAEWQILANAGLHLASYDVVLTTYEALSSDLYHLPTEITHERRSSTRQKRKKYAFVASPLIFLTFWRVCMDEAQVGVENAQLQAALTVAKISAEMKWVVTGTPFSTQVGDLFGCFKFLRLAPYDDEHTGLRFFKEVIEKCFSSGATERVLDILLWDGKPSSSRNHERHGGGGLLWRTSKRDVLSQLNLPEQVTELIWCRFSDVERHFYDEQEKVIVAMVKAYQSQLASNGGGAVADVTEKVWQDLLVLRQICCHPQVGSTLSGMFSLRGGRLGAATNGEAKSGSGGVLSMNDFLKELILKCKRECEEGQRKYLAAQNGLASLHVIQHEIPAAIVKYLSCMQVIKANWDLFRADLLPRLHILENLARCVRMTFKIETSESGSADHVDEIDAAQGAATTASSSSSVRKDLSTLESEMMDISSNPKENSLLPDLPALAKAIVADADGEVSLQATADIEAIARECEMLDVCASKIKKFYLYQVEASHSGAFNAFKAIAKSVDENSLPKLVRSSKRRVLCSSSLWWLSVLSSLESRAPEQVVLFADRLRARLLAFGTKWATRFCNQFSTIAGFQMVFLTELEELAKKRAVLYEKLQKLSTKPPTKKDVELSGNCRRCRDARDGPVCEHCKLYKELESFKQHFLGVDSSAASSASSRSDLFSTPMAGSRRGANIYDDNDADEEQATSASTNTSSLLLEVFREIASSTRAVTRDESDPECPSPQEGLRDELEFWTQVQKEWNAAKKLFQVQHQRLGGLDELEMAMMQIRVRVEGEEVKTASEKLYKLQEHEVSAKFATFQSERVVGELEMRNKMSSLRFLTQMEKQRETPDVDGGDEQLNAGSESEASSPVNKKRGLCAVCLEEMENERVMLPCAHSFCKNCMKTLSNQHKGTGTIRCPTCRRVCDIAKVVVVYEDNETVNLVRKRNSLTVRPVADAHIQLQRGGGYGSKIDAILRRVLALSQQNPHVKCLLFTQWQDMMSIVAAQLIRNGIMCFTYTTKRGFHRVMQQFKMHADPCVLALPFKVGANGLNLVEATEVLLVEPLLNTSIEAQAINRVHRIGQTKQTRVHRLVVDNSVEERIYWLGQKKKCARQRLEASAAAGTAEEEEKEGDADDDADVVAVERAPTKKEREQLTLNDLHVLLDGKMGSSAGNGSAEDGEGERHPFWQDQVLLNGRSLSRHEAKLFVERRHAAECRANDQNADAEPLTHLFDQELNVVVASEIVQLQHVTDLEQSQSISRELLAFHRARLQRELELWRSAAI